RYYFVGMFTNLFVPGLVGGDAARAVYLGRRHHRLGEAAASVVADRGVGMLALFWFAWAMTLLMRDAVPAEVIKPTAAAGALAFAAFAAAPLIARLVASIAAPLHSRAGHPAPLP